MLRRFLKWRISPANLSKLTTLDDRINRDSEAIIVVFQLLLHLPEERFVGKLNASAKGVAQQLAAELADDVVAPHVHEVVAQAGEAVDFLAIGEFGLHVDWPSGEVSFAKAADGVE